MWGGVNDPEGATPGYDPMTHMEFAAATADAQVGRIMDALEESGELDSTLVVLTADHGSVAAADGHWHGDFEPVNDYGYFNWYYGDPENDVFYDQPQEALQPLIDTDNVGLSYSDSSLNVWLKDQSPASVAEAAAIMRTLPDVTAVWRRNGDHFDRVSPIRWDRMHSGGEKSWFARKAQELVDTQAADYGPDLVATLPDDTTYSVLGDHGGIQRSSQQIPIVFAGADLSGEGPARRGEVGRHHADDPPGDGHHADVRHGRHGVHPAQDQALTPATGATIAARRRPAGLDPGSPQVVPSASAEPSFRPHIVGRPHVLFLGNSHTQRHDVAGTVAAMLRASRPRVLARVTVAPGLLHLNERASDEATQRLLRSHQWDVVVLQAQNYSLSGTTDYPNDGSVSLVRIPAAHGCPKAP